MMDFLRRLWGGELRTHEHVVTPPRDDLSPEIVNPRDPEMKLIHVPAGGFWAGGMHADTVRNPGPNGTFEIPYLSDYYLAETEVTNAQYARFLNETQPGASDLRRYIYLSHQNHRHVIVEEGGVYVVTEDMDDHPVTCVSWWGAEAYCVWADLRLPTELEWEKAARGTDGRRFPWGDEWDPGRSHNFDNHHDQGTTPVFAFEDGRSPYGLWDMMGNVREWCWDYHHDYAYRRYRKGDIRPRRSGVERVVRGSDYVKAISEDARHHACSARHGARPNTQNGHLSFRCAMTPPD
ncbi:MAG: formylglycine-generating enzyme family protein [Armatimonadota bacterium]|jgi:sulfatase modifying factor 1